MHFDRTRNEKRAVETVGTATIPYHVPCVIFAKPKILYKGLLLKVSHDMRQQSCGTFIIHVLR